MQTNPEAVKKTARLYLLVGLALFLFTALTVAVATVPALDFGKHGFDMEDCIIGLCIAAVKSSLVAAIFMHLNHERKAIYWIFGGGLVFFFFLGFLTLLAKSDPIHYDGFFK